MKLYPYQQAYIKGLPKNCIMAADTGIGKGQMSLAHYRIYSEGLPLLVIAPASKVRTGDWDREIAMAFGDDFKDYQVVSYDKFAKRPETYAPEPVALILDECHFVANSQAKRSKAVARLIRTRCVQFIGLSATPLPNGWSSLENYAIIFGLVRNKTEFINRYVRIDRTRGFPIILGYNCVQEMEALWSRVAKPLERTGIADLPSSQSLARGVFLPLTKIDEYRDIIKTRVTPDGEMLDSPSKTFAYLRQWTTKYREDELVNLLEGTTEHVVVFYNFNVERDMILKVLKKHFKDRTVYEQSGHASNLPPRSKWATMKPSVTVAQYQSASVAIELTYASVTIYLSPTYSYAQFHQSMGRTKRNGQEKKTLFYMIAVQNTLDEAVYRVLKKKADFSIKLMENYLKEASDGQSKKNLTKTGKSASISGMTGRKKYTSHIDNKEVTRQATHFTVRLHQMDYSTHRECAVALARGKYKGYPFLILNLGTHPVAYVCLPLGHRYFGEHYDLANREGDVRVHGSFTYADSEVYKSTIKDRWWLGWDYSHIGDYMPILPDSLNKDAHKWTREEIISEVKSVISQLDAIK